MNAPFIDAICVFFGVAIIELGDVSEHAVCRMHCSSLALVK